LIPFYCYTLKLTSDSILSEKDAMARRPADPEEELRWMSQEVRGYVEAVLNSLAANVPKVHIPVSINHGFKNRKKPAGFHENWKNLSGSLKTSWLDLKNSKFEKF
jgi:hypothetical protein